MRKYDGEKTSCEHIQNKVKIFCDEKSCIVNLLLLLICCFLVKVEKDNCFFANIFYPDRCHRKLKVPVALLSMSRINGNINCK